MTNNFKSKKEWLSSLNDKQSRKYRNSRLLTNFFCLYIAFGLSYFLFGIPPDMFRIAPPNQVFVNIIRVIILVFFIIFFIIIKLIISCTTRVDYDKVNFKKHLIYLKEINIILFILAFLIPRFI